MATVGASRTGRVASLTGCTWPNEAPPLPGKERHDARPQRRNAATRSFQVVIAALASSAALGPTVLASSIADLQEGLLFYPIGRGYFPLRAKSLPFESLGAFELKLRASSAEL